MKTQEEVLDLLVALGSDEKEMVNKLMSLGIKGTRQKCLDCPIAKYLISNGVGVAEGVVVFDLSGGDDYYAHLGLTVAVDYYYFSLCNYPQVKGILDFILAFDKGKYPQLEV